MRPSLANTSVIFLDDNNDLRELIQSLIESQFHISCHSFATLSEIQKNEALALSSQVAILDIELGFKQPSGIEAYNWLKQKGYRGTIFFLTGHGCYNPLVEAATDLGAAVWEKPISSAKIISDLRKLIPAQKPELIAETVA